MISFLAILAYLPCADDPANVATPGVDHEVILIVHVPERANPDLAVVTPPVLGFDDRVLEDQGSVPEIDTVLVEISPPLFLVPFEGDCLRYTFVDTLVKSSNCRREYAPIAMKQKAPVPRRSGTRRLRRRSRKNQALRRWLVRFAAQPDDRGQQWWEDFDALLRHTRMRRHPIDA